MIKCKITSYLNSNNTCDLTVAGVKRIAVTNFSRNHTFTTSGEDCFIDTISLDDDYFYPINFAEGSGYANSTVEQGGTADNKSLIHQVGFTLTSIDCNMISNWQSYLMGRLVFAVETKSGTVFIYGHKRGLRASQFDLNTGTAETDESGITALYEGKQASMPLVVKDWSIIEALYAPRPVNSISFDNDNYNITTTEGTAGEVGFRVYDNNGNDITDLCEITVVGQYVEVEGDEFVIGDNVSAGRYQTIATVTYQGKTATTTVYADVEASAPTSISFSQATYSVSGYEGDFQILQLTVNDNYNNNVTLDCTFTLSPDNTGMSIENGEVGLNAMNAGTYNVTVTATYDGLTATATINATILHNYATDYLTFEAIESGTFTLTIPAAIDSTYMTSVSYSVNNGQTWTTRTNDNYDQIITTPTIQAGGKVLWKGIGSIMGSTIQPTTNFSSTGTFNVEGNIMSLLYGDNFQNQTTFPSGSTHNFRLLFADCKIVSAENLMLSATTLVQGCYAGLFTRCTSLTTAPELPATTLAISCYNNMFVACTSLTTAPVLNATTLVDYCYYYMFRNCERLNHIKMLATDISATNCLSNWVTNVASSGTFIKAASATIPTGTSGIPANWTVISEINP